MDDYVLTTKRQMLQGQHGNGINKLRIRKEMFFLENISPDADPSENRTQEEHRNRTDRIRTSIKIRRVRLGGFRIPYPSSKIRRQDRASARAPLYRYIQNVICYGKATKRYGRYR
jgi:hypothetical protein